MKKYNTMTEILEDETLGLFEMEEAVYQYLREKKMTMEEFMLTEEGQKIQEKKYLM